MLGPLTKIDLGQVSKASLKKLKKNWPQINLVKNQEHT